MFIYPLFYFRVFIFTYININMYISMYFYIFIFTSLYINKPLSLYIFVSLFLYFSVYCSFLLVAFLVRIYSINLLRFYTMKSCVSLLYCRLS